LRPTDLDLSCVIADLVTMLRGVIGNTVQVEFDADPTPAAVHADQRQIEQVLMNLCLNARDAMPEGGRVRIQTRRVHLTEEFCALHPSALPGDHIRLTVEDDGIGMDESTLGQIFEPFFTTKEVGQGTGLGLATVYGIVQQHNGIIDVSSAVGRGTTFAIYLHAIDHAVAPAPKMEDIEPPTGTETLLLAEDFGEVRDLTVRVLEQAGYDVLVAANGQEAVRLFEGNEERIALALLDMVMPRMGGREAAHRIRQMKPGLPVLLTSGYSADVIDTRFLEEEGMGFITKPASQAELLRGVRELIDASRTRRESEPGRRAA
jgi:CheY-like chemotaxis protein